MQTFWSSNRGGAIEKKGTTCNQEPLSFDPLPGNELSGHGSGSWPGHVEVRLVRLGGVLHSEEVGNMSPLEGAASGCGELLETEYEDNIGLARRP